MFHSTTTIPSQEPSSRPASLPVSQFPQGTDEKGSFSFSLHISRPQDPSLAHLALVEPVIRSHTQSAETKKKNAVVFLVDNSGSMYGSKFTAVQKALKDILHEDLHDDDYLEVITFGNSAEKVLNGKQSTLASTLDTTIDGLKADGAGTQFASPFELIDPSKIPEGYDLTVIFLTDGEETLASRPPAEILERMNKKFLAKGRPKPKVASIGVGGGSKLEITKKFDQPQEHSLSLYASDSKGIKKQFGQAIKVMHKRYFPAQWALKQEQGSARSKDLGTIEEGGSLVGAAFTIPTAELQHAGKLRCGFKLADEEFAGEVDLANFDLEQRPYDVSYKYLLQDAARIQTLPASPVRKVIMLKGLKKEAGKIAKKVGVSKAHQDFLDVVNRQIHILEKLENSAGRREAIQDELNLIAKATLTLLTGLKTKQLMNELAEAEAEAESSAPPSASELKKENTASYFTDPQSQQKYRVIPAEPYLMAFEDDLVDLMEEKNPVAFSHTVLRGEHEKEVLVLNDLNDEMLQNHFSVDALASLEDIVAAVQSLETVKTSELVRRNQTTLSLAECVKNKKGDAFVKALLCGILLTKKLKKNNPAFPEGSVRVYMDQDDFFQGTYFWCTYKTKEDHHIYLLDASNGKSPVVADLTLEKSQKEVTSRYAKRGLPGVLRGLLDLFGYPHPDVEFQGFSPALCAAASEGVIPDLYACPISHGFMGDPVYVEQKKQIKAGVEAERKEPAFEVWRSHAFDRDSIQKWYDDGHSTNPLTNLPTLIKLTSAEDLRPKLKRFLAKSYVPQENPVVELKRTPPWSAKTKDKASTQSSHYFMPSSQAKPVTIAVTGLPMKQHAFNPILAGDSYGAYPIMKLLYGYAPVENQYGTLFKVEGKHRKGGCTDVTAGFADLPCREFLEIVINVLLTYSILQKKKIYHGDLKPGKLLRDAEGYIYPFDFEAGSINATAKQLRKDVIFLGYLIRSLLCHYVARKGRHPSNNGGLSWHSNPRAFLLELPEASQSVLDFSFALFNTLLNEMQEKADLDQSLKNFMELYYAIYRQKPSLRFPRFVGPEEDKLEQLLTSYPYPKASSLLPKIAPGQTPSTEGPAFSLRGYRNPDENKYDTPQGLAKLLSQAGSSPLHQTKKRERASEPPSSSSLGLKPGSY